MRRLLKQIAILCASFAVASIALTHSSFAQERQIRSEVLFDKGIYFGVYSEVLEQPLKVHYFVHPSNFGDVSRSGMNFYEELEYHTSDDDDYYRNVWDKGHMAPAATFDKTEEMLRTTFSYLNSALQHQRLNRYHWRYLEAYERELSEEIQDTVYVTIEVQFDTVVELLPTGASVPSGFYKFLSYGEEEECYYFPNRAPTKDWKEYKINCEL